MSTLPLGEADKIIDGLQATLATRQLVALAVRAGLKPHRLKGVHRGSSYRIIVDSRSGTGSLFGCIDVSAITGRVLRGYLMRDTDAKESRYNLAGTRAAIKTWEETASGPPPS